MTFYKMTLIRLSLICMMLVHSALSTESSTAKSVFDKGSVEERNMLVNLTYLSYLTFDKQNDFKIYKLMYGLDSQKKEKLLRYLANESKYYTNQGWKLDFLDVGKGLFSNSDAPGAVIASRCTPASAQDPQRTCEVEIGFRGTRTPNDWGNNINFLKTPMRFVDSRIDKSKYKDIFKDGQVHKGFLKAYNTVSQKISDTLEGLRKDDPNTKFEIRIGGHSLGGSLAIICAAHLAANFKNGQNTIQLETYGSPRTLGVKLSEELTKILGAENILRFVNMDIKGVKDKVPSMPLEKMLTAQFRHVGEECILTPLGDEIYEGIPQLKALRTPHRIEGYKSGYENQRQCGSKQPQKGN